jgi:hypothetical protein
MQAIAYLMCLMAYLGLMAAVLAVAGWLLCFVPSKRRLALSLGGAALLSLPGMLAFQFVCGIGLGILLALSFAFYAVAQPPDSVQWAIGIPLIVIMLASLAGASTLGCYAGARIGWLVGGGAPFTANRMERKLVQALQELRREVGDLPSGVASRILKNRR